MPVARSLPLLFGVLAFVSSGHAGAGVFLRWDQCLSDGGAQNKAFACNVNTGKETLVGGFELGADMTRPASGNEITLDIASASVTLPAWWQFRNAGTCRQTSLTMNFVVSPLAINCVDWASGVATGAIGAYTIGLRGPNTARIFAAASVPVGIPEDPVAGQEYFSFNLVISNEKTAGDGSCAGCQTPVCLYFTRLAVTTAVAADNLTLSGPANGVDSDVATWQGGALCLFTPTVQRTWGGVKALYR